MLEVLGLQRETIDDVMHKGVFQGIGSGMAVDTAVGACNCN
jgi:hypothetical protein